MKKQLLLLFLLTLSISGHSESDISVSDKQVRDSVFHTLSQITSDTLRLNRMRQKFDQHLDKDWSFELLDSALVLSRKLKQPELELSLYYEINCYYKARNDINGREKYLKELKSVSYKYKMYDTYYALWSDLLSTKSGIGNTETTFIEAGQMKRDADSLGYKKGILIADMAKAMSLHHAMKFDKSSKLYNEILKSPEVTHEQKADIYYYLSNMYIQQQAYDDALETLKKRDSELQFVMQGKLQEDCIAQLTHLEFAYCKLYLAISDTKELKLHLDKLKSYQGNQWVISHYINYHLYMGGYYALIDDMDKSYEEYDRALEIGKDIKAAYMINVHKMKGQSAFLKKNYKLAAENYRNATLFGDSNNQEIAHNNTEAHQANYRIRKALLDQESNEKHYNLLKAGTAILLLLTLTSILWHIFHTNKILRRSKKEALAAWAMADTNNKMKESFLRNITEEIKKPIDVVISCSSILSSRNHLSQEYRQAYAQTIQQHSKQLIQLVSNVLDLSRLEAGMMRFNVQKHDLVTLCREAQAKSENQERNPWKQTFRTDLNSLVTSVDSHWFTRVLIFAISAPENFHEEFEVIYTLTTDTNYARIIIDIHPETASAQNLRMDHDINRLYLETFGGTYCIEEQQIVITYPIGLNR